MKNKIQAIFIGAFALTTFGSCENWLNVRPESSYPDELMFETVTGFRDAVVGAYMVMRDGAYYPDGTAFGGSGGSGLIEPLSCFWYVNSEASELMAHLYNRDYTSDAVNGVIGRHFTALHRINTNVNLIWRGLENQDVLDDYHYNMVRGEVCAMRAYTHFDVLRAFGPVPGHQNPSEKILPYVKTISVLPFDYQTYDDYIKLLWDDINEAERCLAKVDPILTNSNTAINTQAMGWGGFRYNRMNYYAVLALRARLNLWLGNRDEALADAKTIIAATDGESSSSPRFPLTPAARVIGNNDVRFSSEHIFSIKSKSFTDTRFEIFAFFFNGGERIYDYPTDSPSNDPIIEFPDFFSPGDVRGLGGIIASGRRHVPLSVSVPGNYIKTTYKYIPRKGEALVAGSLGTMSLPLIRVSEMYLIVMECGTLAESNAAYQSLCTARESEYVEITEANRIEIVMKEYAREFYQEGQSFFAYKRKGLSRPPFWGGTLPPPPTEPAQYVLPLPNSERNMIQN
ncbi:hypothetical protein LJC45_00725 [Alistipes sp. OttesenSCG-928-B03]|nr:hypothetical protein [Alistipes sp. OttesenSCG-928-B03]